MFCIHGYEDPVVKTIPRCLFRAPGPGEKGWVMRARVPMPSHKDYVVRPKWKVEEKSRVWLLSRSYYFARYRLIGNTVVVVFQGAAKKTLNRYERKQRELMEKRMAGKAQRAVTISIEGKNMALWCCHNSASMWHRHVDFALRSQLLRLCKQS